MSHLSASFSATIRVRLSNAPGSFARLAQAIGDAGGSFGAIDLVRVDKDTKIRDVTVEAADADHLARIVESVRRTDGIEVERVSDRTFLMHLGGKIEMRSKIPVKTRDDLSMAYTPGVARVCRAIADEPGLAYRYTIRSHTVAIVTDGTAVLGLGDIGPEAAMPVMEGKAMLFKEFGGVDAWPICLATKDVDEIVSTVKAIAPSFGGVNLEDISAPRCFEIEERLKRELDIPVFHDDQHGTAVVVLAALINALRITGKRMSDLRVVISGAGAAGVAITRILMQGGVSDIIVCDRAGAIHRARTEHMNASKDWLAQHTNPHRTAGTIGECVRGANVFIGVSTPGAVTVDELRAMAPDPVIFTLANPTPEMPPEQVEDFAAVVATGRSDYPNQINNVMCFPGVFRGALDVRATTITEGMKVAAGHAIASVIADDELGPEYVIPSVFNRDVTLAVAAAVAEAAERDGVARRSRG